MTRANIRLSDIVKSVSFMCIRQAVLEWFRHCKKLLLRMNFLTSLTLFRNETKCNNNTLIGIAMRPLQDQERKLQQATHMSAGAH